MKYRLLTVSILQNEFFNKDKKWFEKVKYYISDSDENPNKEGLRHVNKKNAENRSKIFSHSFVPNGSVIASYTNLNNLVRQASDKNIFKTSKDKGFGYSTSTVYNNKLKDLRGPYTKNKQSEFLYFI